MSTFENPIILIPARMASTRLPGKPLADIAGLPMIIQVMRRAEEANIGPVAVACCEQEVANAVTHAGGNSVMTDPDLPSGSDRIFAALDTLDPNGNHDAVLNVQGDLPTLEPRLIQTALDALEGGADIATLLCTIKDEAEKTNPNVVKCAASIGEGETSGRALYFSRNPIPSGEGPLYHHIGMYAYRRPALARFVSAPPGVLEKRESLEQLRALEMGMCMKAAVVDTVPLGVDTPEDLERARQILGAGG